MTTTSSRKSCAARLLAASLLCGGVTAACATESETSKVSPNILLIVVDDLGYDDLGLSNPERHTPNINELAAQGVRFSRHYTDATCSPTRVGLLTGLDPARLGFRPVQQGISPETMTLPKVLSAAGYNTFHVGKWHVGNSIPELSPQQAGFDHWFGFLTQWELAGPSRDGIHFGWPRYNRPWLQSETSPPAETPGHLTDIVTDKAVQVIEDLSRDSKPWFLNLWYYAPHDPVQPAQRFADKYPDTGEGRYRALIEQLDYSIGRLTAQLQQLGISENTLVIFMSDNGGTNKYVDNNRPLVGRKGEFNEGGVRTPMIWRWPAKLSANRVIDDTVSYLDLLPTLSHLIDSNRDQGIGDIDLAGVNLWPAINGAAPFPKRYLFWEYLAHSYVYYSILDKDGRWRLIYENGRNVLYDLETPSHEQHNVRDQNPEVAERLLDEYKQWRREQHEVRVEIETVGNNGSAIVTGDGVQRSPGHSAFTFAIGVTPTATGEAENATQFIANHPPYWSLSFKPGRELTLNMLGERLRGPVLGAGRCAAIVVSSAYGYSRRYPKNNRALINLYVDGILVDSVVNEKPAIAPSQFDRPTTIGFESDPGGQLSHLKLTIPRFYNEWFAPAGESKTTSNTVEGLTDSLCLPDSTRGKREL